MYTKISFENYAGRRFSGFLSFHTRCLVGFILSRRSDGCTLLARLEVILLLLVVVHRYDR